MPNRVLLSSCTASATPDETKCPFMTTTINGAENLLQCFVEDVHVCDKYLDVLTFLNLLINDLIHMSAQLIAL